MKFFINSLLILGSFTPSLIFAEALTPENAWSKAGEPLPVGARYMDPEEFKSKVSNGKLELVTPRLIRDSKQTEKARYLTNLKYLQQFARQNPHINSLMKQPAPGSVAKTEDGNFLHAIRDNRGVTSDVVTMGEVDVVNDLAEGIRREDTKENKLALYAAIYHRLPKKFLTDHGNRLKIQSPAAIRTHSKEKISLYLENFVGHINLIKNYIDVIDVTPANFPTSCANEVGAGSGSDRTGNFCPRSSNGLFSLISYPLKWFATCVKNQGQRGTCVSFATTAAMETSISEKFNTWVNLSEQKLYHAAKAQWHPSTFGDGLSTSATMQEIVSKNYNFPYEYQWDYNPSPFRSADADSQTYVNSCNAYTGEHCSDTNHQADVFCVDVLAYSYCAFDGSIVGAAPFRALSTGQIWNPFQVFYSIGLAELMSALKVPMTVSIPVTESFDNASSDGFVTYVNGTEDNRGGHAVEVLGVIPNSDLPASRQGAGGGYMILKNSWGACWKDAGYVYVPYAWAASYFRTLNTINSIN